MADDDLPELSKLLDKNSGQLYGKAVCVETERGNRIEEGMCLERGLSFDRFRNRETYMRGEVNW